jgi:Peptide methionine sulfoxide reductase
VAGACGQFGGVALGLREGAGVAQVLVAQLGADADRLLPPGGGVRLGQVDPGAQAADEQLVQVLFYTSDEQRQVAWETIADADASGIWHGKVLTKVSEAGPFWQAQAEDQDYLRDYPLGKNQFRP